MSRIWEHGRLCLSKMKYEHSRLCACQTGAQSPVAPRSSRQRCSKAKLMVMKACLADLNATTGCPALLCNESIKRHQAVPGIYDERIRFHPPREYLRLGTHPMPCHIEPLAR